MTHLLWLLQSWEWGSQSVHKLAFLWPKGGGYTTQARPVNPLVIFHLRWSLAQKQPLPPRDLKLVTWDGSWRPPPKAWFPAPEPPCPLFLLNPVLLFPLFSERPCHLPRPSLYTLAGVRIFCLQSEKPEHECGHFHLSKKRGQGRNQPAPGNKSRFHNPISPPSAGVPRAGWGKEKAGQQEV